MHSSPAQATAAPAPDALQVQGIDTAVVQNPRLGPHLHDTASPATSEPPEQATTTTSSSSSRVTTTSSSRSITSSSSGSSSSSNSSRKETMKAEVSPEADGFSRDAFAVLCNYVLLINPPPGGFPSSMCQMTP
jgi:hypothetical protein